MVMWRLFKILILFYALTATAKETLVIPEKYEEKNEILKERGRIIPKQANQATSAGALTGKILEYHLSDVLKNNRIAPIKSVKSLESAMNNNANIESDNFKLKSKFDMNRLQATLDIESFINTQIWTEDSFKTLRSKLKLYEISQGDISIQNRVNSEDNRTYLNLEKTW